MMVLGKYSVICYCVDAHVTYDIILATAGGLGLGARVSIWVGLGLGLDVRLDFVCLF